MIRRDFILGTIAASTLAASAPSKAASPVAAANSTVPAQNNKDAKTIAFALYPYMTPQDIIGPTMTLQNWGFNIQYVWHDRSPLPTEIPLMTFTPTTTFDELDKVDILCVTGTRNPFNAIADEKMVAWVNRVGKKAEYVTSVCTGAIILAAAGLLDGYKASTHWAYEDTLVALGGNPSPERVTVDRNRITGAGVTAALDFSFNLLSVLRSEDVAKLMQLLIQYDPQPPFKAGNPKDAGPVLTERAIKGTDMILDRETPKRREMLAAAITRKNALFRSDN